MADLLAPHHEAVQLLAEVPGLGVESMSGAQEARMYVQGADIRDRSTAMPVENRRG